MDSLIVLKWQNMQSSWYEGKALPNNWYGRSETVDYGCQLLQTSFGISYIFLV